MSSKFLELLNLNKELESNLSLFKVRKISETEENHYEVIFEAKRNLQPEELVELVRKIGQFNQVKIKAQSIKIIQPTEAEENYEIYSSLRFIMDMMANINHSHYLVEVENDVVVIKTAKREAQEKLDFHLKNIKMFLRNFGIWNGNVRVELDKSSLDYTHFNKRKTDKLNASVELEKSNPQVIDGYKLINPSSIREAVDKAYFEGEVFFSEVKKTRRGGFLVNIKIAKDYKALAVVKFENNEENVFAPKKGSYIRVYGKLDYSSYSKEYQISADIIQQLDPSIDKEPFIEDVPGKRAELHIHTKMSAMDGVASVKNYVNRAKEMGLTAIAITDHNSVQAFPDANYVDGIKVIYGTELDVVNDIDATVVYNEDDRNLRDANYVHFDLETTGISPLNDEIIEFGGVKIKDGQVVGRLQLFIKPTVEISEATTKLTGITNADVISAKTIAEAIPEIIEFFEDAVLVAHNAEFDYTFLNSHLRRNGYPEIKNAVIDTMKVSWILNPANKFHRLSSVARVEGVDYDDQVAHRADYDAEVLYKVFDNMLLRMLEKDIRKLSDLNKFVPELMDYIFADHVTVLAKNQEGLKELYKITSDSNTKYFNRRKKSPQIPLSELLSRRDNLLIGSACDNGIAFKAATLDLKDIDRIFRYFDYIEIFPTNVYSGQIVKGFYTREGIQEVLKKLYSVAKNNDIIPVATGNTHYVNEEDKVARDVYISARGLGGKLHPLWNRNNPAYRKPDQHLRSTSSMIGNMQRIFKSEKIAEELTITNSNIIVDMIEDIKPLKKDLYTPTIAGAREEFLKLIEDNTKRLYGDNPPEWIKERIEREVESITKHGFDIVYFLSSLAVRKSLQDGYLVGSRGSVGSSIAATLTDITEVNPLEPHYLCSSCKHVEKVEGVGSGYDLPHKGCPVCGTMMKGEGQDIPFETFLGFEGDKVPDIDLNFSGEYQPKIHQFIKEELGEKNVFRAGTISTVATKTAFGYVRGYHEAIGEDMPSNTTIEYIASVVEGTKRTTGQHPGGLIVVPDELDIEDFSPINYPGNDADAQWLTTHFDFHSIHDNLLKLDLLGHIDPSAIRMLEDITGIDSRTQIDMNDQDVMSLFTSNEKLNIKKKYIKEELGILGIPEFGTSFVRELVRDAKPKTFADLVRVSGLSHGTDVWLGNAKDIIDNNIGELKDVISVRDDIMTYLIRHGVEPLMSFMIMEAVRKGQLPGHPKRLEWERAMRDNNVPEWYIESCNKIKYMFPKAHATAYVMMAFRIAWYKVNEPLAYYATYFTKRDNEWDIDTMYKQPEEIIKYRENVSKMGWEASDKEKTTSDTFLILLEMLSRGYGLEDISIEKSHATDWTVNEEGTALIPPFNIIEGLGDSAALKLTAERDERPFETVQDFEARSGVNGTIRSKLKDMGVLGTLSSPQEDTVDVFNMFE